MLAKEKRGKKPFNYACQRGEKPFKYACQREKEENAL